MYWGWTIFYAGLTGATVSIALAAWWRDRVRLKGVAAASVILFLTFVATNLSFALMGPRHMVVYPMMDAMVAAFFVVLWLRTWAPWAICIFGLLIAECIEHVLYDRISGHTHAETYSYDVALNVLYSLQLSCVAVPAFASILRRRGVALRNTMNQANNPDGQSVRFQRSNR